MGRKDQPVSGTEQLLAQARARLRRLEPWEAAAALDQWAVLADIRPAAQRAAEGEIPGALVVERNVLEWRFDPTGPDRLPMAHRDLQVIVICSEGYTSSLAAAALQDIGLHRATDVVGGVKAWVAAGLPTTGGTGRAGRSGDPDHDLGPAGAVFASGIVVVSALSGDGRPVGVAVRSFMSLTGDEPLVVVALPSTSRTLLPVLARGTFGVSVLGADQVDLARRFASGLPIGERFDGVAWSAGDSGVPLVDGSLSTMACALERESPAGDHVIVIGRVTSAHVGGDEAPLLYHRGGLVLGHRRDSEPVAVARSQAED